MSRSEHVRPQVEPDESESYILDSFLLIFASLIGLSVSLTVIGLIPVGIILFGAVAGLKSGNKGYLRTSVSIVSIIGYLTILLGFFALVYSVYSYNSEDYEPLMGVAISVLYIIAAVFFLAALRLLWLKPMLRQFTRVQGLFFGLVPERQNHQKILARESHQTYSVADEIKKWNALRQDGTINDSEYEVARRRLLKDD